MRIKRICYPVNVLGPGNRVGIWVTGCGFHCKGCMSPELQDYKSGNDFSVENIMSMLNEITKPIDGFTISGGEPFEQFDELCSLVNAIYNDYSDDIIIYTGYKYEELKIKYKENLNKVTSKISVIVDGRFIEENNDYKGLRGSSNQKIICFNNEQKYKYMNECNRKTQVFNYMDGFTLTIGIL